MIAKVRDWAKTEFKLKNQPSYHEVRSILRNEEETMQYAAKSGKKSKIVWCRRDNVLDEQ